MISASPSEFSPKLYARIGGVLYLYIILAGIFVELFVRGKLVVSGDAAATASNIMAHEARWRVAFSAEVLWLACAVALTMIFNNCMLWRSSRSDCLSTDSESAWYFLDLRNCVAGT